MMEVRGTLPPNRHVAESCCWAASVSFVVLGPATGHTAQTPKSPGPLVKGLEEKSPPAFPQHSQQPQDPQTGRCPPSHHSGHSSCSGGSKPQAAFTKPHPHQAPKNSASSRHRMGTDRPHGGQFPPVGPRSNSPAPSQGLPKDPSPRAQPCTGAPNPGCVTKPPADTTDTPSPSP